MFNHRYFSFAAAALTLMASISLCPAQESAQAPVKPRFARLGVKPWYERLCRRAAASKPSIREPIGCKSNAGAHRRFPTKEEQAAEPIKWAMEPTTRLRPPARI